MVADGVHPSKGGKDNHGGDIDLLVEEAYSLGSWRMCWHVRTVRIGKLGLSHFYDSGLGVLPESKGAAVNIEPTFLLSHSIFRQSLHRTW